MINYCCRTLYERSSAKVTKQSSMKRWSLKKLYWFFAVRDNFMFEKNVVFYFFHELLHIMYCSRPYLKNSKSILRSTCWNIEIIKVAWKKIFKRTVWTSGTYTLVIIIDTTQKLTPILYISAFSLHVQMLLFRSLCLYTCT